MFPRITDSGLDIHKHSSSADGGNQIDPAQIYTQWLRTTAFGVDANATGVTTNQNDFNPRGTGQGWGHAIFTGAASFNVTGLETTWFVSPFFTGTDAIVFLSRTASGVTTLVDGSALSALGNRFAFGGVNITIAQNETVALYYDVASNVWRFLFKSFTALPTATAGPDANISIDAAGAAGTAGTFAQSQHGHQLVTTDAPSGANVTMDAAPAAGAAGAAARATHGHRLNRGTAIAAVGTANAAGTSGHGPPSDDHTHKLQGAAIQSASGSTGSLAASTGIDVTVTWPSAFADTNYKVAIALAFADATNRQPPTFYIKTDGTNAPSTTRIIVRVFNNGAAAETITVWAIAIHD